MPSFFNTRRIFTAPQADCSLRILRTCLSNSGSLRFGELLGRRDLSFNPLSPLSRYRLIHLYPVAGLIPYRRHSFRTFAPGWHANFTNSVRNCMEDTSWKGISFHLELPYLRMCSPCPRMSVHHVSGLYRQGGVAARSRRFREATSASRRRGGWFKSPIIGSLNQPPRPLPIRWLRDFCLRSRPPLLCQGGE